MQRTLQDLLADCSTERGFQFSITCEVCGGVWKSRTVPFSKARVSPATAGKKVVYETLYRREKEEARRQAWRAGERRFSRCPICQRWVCDRCFMVCEDLDMCTQCAEKLDVRGSIVG